MTDRRITGVHTSEDSPTPVAPFDQDDFVEPEQQPPPSWLTDSTSFEGLDRPSAGVIHDVIGDREPVRAPEMSPVLHPEPALADAAPRPPVPPPAVPAAAPSEAGPRPRSKNKVPRSKPRTQLARRTVRHVDPWSVLKLSLLFYSCLFLVFLVAGVILWLIAMSVGAIGNIEEFLGSLIGDKNFHFLGSRILEGTVLGGCVLVAIAAAFTVLLTVFFNLIADIVGGVEITIVEHNSDRPSV